MEKGGADITHLLRQWREGDRAAEARLFEVLLPELRRIAGNCMSGERPGHTLQPTELVGRVYERLVRAKDRNWESRSHFLAVAAKAMRWYLIDYARSRPSKPVLPLDDAPTLPVIANLDTAVMVNSLLDELAGEHPELCSTVELKYFLGLSDEETAAALKISIRKAQRQWHDARSWMFERLENRAVEHGQ